MIRAYVFDLWSRLWRGAPLDVYVGPVTPPREVLDAVSEEYARHQAKPAVAPESAPEPEPDTAPVRSYQAPIPPTNLAATSNLVVAAEEWLLAELAVESAQPGVSPWVAAQRVFGCPPVRRGAEWLVVCRVRG